MASGGQLQFLVLASRENSRATPATRSYLGFACLVFPIPSNDSEQQSLLFFTSSAPARIGWATMQLCRVRHDSLPLTGFSLICLLSFPLFRSMCFSILKRTGTHIPSDLLHLDTAQKLSSAQDLQLA